MKTDRYYKYLIKPNLEQKEIIIRTFGAVRFVFNRYLDDVRSGKITKGLAKDIVNEYRKEYPFLNGIDGSALMNVIFQAQGTGISLSHHKSRRDSRMSYTTSNLERSPIRIILNQYIQLPRLGNVEMVYHRPIPENARIKKATVIREANGKYYVSVMVEQYRETPEIPINFANSIGIDYSSGHFYVDNSGNRIDMPHFFKESEETVIENDRRLGLMTKGSINYYKLKMKRAARHQRIRNQRTDFLHKLTTKLANEYDVVCLEDLDMKKISQHLDLGQRTYDNAYGLFNRYLDYKMKERGKLLLRVDRYYPSSKTCHNCGYVNHRLTLNDRIWQCPQCGAMLDRDVNAAINIRNKAISDYLRRRVSG